MRLLFHASYASPAIDTTNVPTERALRDREADGSFYAPDRSHSPGQVLISLSVVSEARRGKAPARAQCVRALSIQRLEGSRPRLRRTRALWKFNGGKERRGAVPRLCRRARHVTV